MASFANDEDVHRTVASEVFGVPLADETGRPSGLRPGVEEVKRGWEAPEPERVLHRPLLRGHVLEVGQGPEVAAQASTESRSSNAAQRSRCASSARPVASSASR